MSAEPNKFTQQLTEVATTETSAATASAASAASVSAASETSTLSAASMDLTSLKESLDSKSLQFKLDEKNKPSPEFRKFIRESKNLLKLKLTGHYQFSLIYTGLAVNQTITYLDLTGLFPSMEEERRYGYGFNTVIPDLTAMMSKNKTISTLILDNNPLGDERLKSLASAFTPKTDEPSITTLTHLSLSRVFQENRRFTKSAINTFVASIASHPSLVSLTFANNNVEEEGTTPFAELLSSTNSQLTTLNLRNSMLCTKACIAIGQALTTNTSLTSLDLSGNHIAEMSILPHFSTMFRVNRNLTSLNLDFTSAKSGVWDEAVVNNLADSLSQNRSLTDLKLAKPNLDLYKCFERFNAALRQNRTLTTLEIGEVNGASAAATFDMTSPERKALLERNKKIQTTQKLNVGRVAILTAFVRANEKSALNIQCFLWFPKLSSRWEMLIIIMIGIINRTYSEVS